jgi:hypothetical protein
MVFARHSAARRPYWTIGQVPQLGVATKTQGRLRPFGLAVVEALRCMDVPKYCS